MELLKTRDPEGKLAGLVAGPLEVRPSTGNLAVGEETGRRLAGALRRADRMYIPEGQICVRAHPKPFRDTVPEAFCVGYQVDLGWPNSTCGSALKMW